MTRSLAAILCFGALLGTPAPSQAGVIPWVYDSIFGYGPHWGGYGWGAGYRGYMTGYAPSFYSASYDLAYGGNACCNTTNYAPWTGYSFGGACCSPCGSSCGNCCGNACGTGCDPGCSNCPGGNCGTGSSGTTTVPSTPADTGTSSQQPTYAPPTTSNDRSLPADEFKPAPRSRDTVNPGSSIPNPNPGGFTNPGGADPNDSPPPFAPVEPGNTRRSNEDVRRAPKPQAGEEKIAFKTPARFTRTTLQPVFELPTIVSAPPRTAPEAVPAPTAVASK